MKPATSHAQEADFLLAENAGEGVWLRAVEHALSIPSASTDVSIKQIELINARDSSRQNHRRSAAEGVGELERRSQQSGRTHGKGDADDLLP